MAKVDRVNAQFGGRDVVFRIDREAIDVFEAFVGVGAFELFKRLAGGEWRIADVKDVLRFALLSKTRIDHLRTMIAMPVSASYGQLAQGSPLLRLSVGDNEQVNDVLARNPVAPYAMLAQGILAAVLFGLEEEEALFRESEHA